MHFLTGVCAIVGGIFTGTWRLFVGTFLAVLGCPFSSSSFLLPYGTWSLFVFAVAGLIDSMIYHSSRALQKKIDLGKATWVILTSAWHNEQKLRDSIRRNAWHYQHNFIDLYKIPSNAHFKFEEAVFRQVIYSSEFQLFSKMVPLDLQTVLSFMRFRNSFSRPYKINQ